MQEPVPLAHENILFYGTDPFCLPQRQRKTFMSTAQRLRQEGRQEGRLEGRQGAIIQLLEIRHKRIPAGLREAVAAVSDERHLERLLLAAAQSNSLEKFAEKL